MPGTLKRPILFLNRIICQSTARKRITKLRVGDLDALEHDYDGDQKYLQSLYRKKEKRLSAQEERSSIQAKRREEEDIARALDEPQISGSYGTMVSYCPGLLSTEYQSELSKGIQGETVSFIARIHHTRNVSSKLAFIILRVASDTIQAVLEYNEGVVSEQFVRWAEHLYAETIVLVHGKLRTPPEPVRSCTFHKLELLVDRMHVLVPVENPLCIDVFAMEQMEENEQTHENQLMVSNRVRTANRVVFLRTPAIQSIFRIRSRVCHIFRSVLDEEGFIEIQTPKLQPAATESGASVFPVHYFGRTAYLAQSPQLAKQMAISADLGRVYEIGPVFRAEDSNTPRHLTEYTGLDLEMSIVNDYHEVVSIVDRLLKAIFEEIYSKYRKEIDDVKRKFPHDDLVWLPETPILKFDDAIRLLNSSWWVDDNGRPASETEDLSTRAEIRLGQLVKEKYGTDYFILDKFPAAARPFYTHLDQYDETWTNSFDVFLRGQEIATGGQRINDPKVLIERMEKAGVDPNTMEDYVQAFEWGAPPHAGCGIGLERILFLMLKLGDVRNASLFPRDPKSLPAKPMAADRLPFPKADTVTYAFSEKHKDMQPPDLEELICNYGDATNTSWLDDCYNVWRDPVTGAAVGYAEENGFALIMGDPLCDPRQYASVISSFLRYIKKRKDVRPIWLLVSAQVEEILGSKLGWRSLTAVAEERVDTLNALQVAKKERQAKNADVKIYSTALGEPVPDHVREKCDKRIQDWKDKRKGKRQVHMTDVRPWISIPHRRYLWAEDKQGEIAGLIILHRLSPKNGFQIKFALDFPGSPSGTIEALISQSLRLLQSSGIRNVTFGAGAMEELEIGHNLNGFKAKILSHTYKTVAKQLGLGAKSEFREKFGTKNDPVYICYPFMGLGISGARTLIKFFEDGM